MSSPTISAPHSNENAPFQEHYTLTPEKYVDEEPFTARKLNDYITENRSADKETSIRCLVFPTGSIRPKTFTPPTGIDVDESTSRTLDSFDFSSMFPNGAFSVRIATVPGTTYPLLNHFCFLISQNRAPAPLNQAIDWIFDRVWTGNIVVAKYGRIYETELIKIDVFEIPTIKLYLLMWLDEYLEQPQSMSISREICITHHKGYEGINSDTSLNGITTNGDVGSLSEEVQQSVNKDYRARCTVYPCAGTRVQTFWAKWPNPASRRCRSLPQDLDFRDFFPIGYISFILSTLPGTNYLMPNNLRIYVSRDSGHPNHTIRRMFNQEWLGNIIVVKYAYKKSSTIQTTFQDLEFINTVIGMWLDDYYRMESEDA